MQALTRFVLRHKALVALTWLLIAVAGVMTVNAIHQDVPFTADMTDAINAEIASLAAWLTLDLAHRS